MSVIPKHEKKQKRGKQPPQAPQVNTVVLTGPESYPATPPLQHDVNHVTGLADIQESLEFMARGINKLTDEDHPVNLILAQGSNTNPVQITLKGNDYDDTMDRLVTAFERIADSVARLAGLTRPRLESWHEQDEYTPRFKDVACDGGAPGPKAPEQKGS